MTNRRNIRSLGGLTTVLCAHLRGVFHYQVHEALALLLRIPFSPAKLLDLKLEDSHVLQPLVILALSFIQHRLLNLDLLIEQSSSSFANPSCDPRISLSLMT